MGYQKIQLNISGREALEILNGNDALLSTYNCHVEQDSFSVFASHSAARQIVPTDLRKNGISIVYKLSDGYWYNSNIIGELGTTFDIDGKWLTERIAWESKLFPYVRTNNFGIYDSIVDIKEIKITDRRLVDQIASIIINAVGVCNGVNSLSYIIYDTYGGYTGGVVPITQGSATITGYGLSIIFSIEEGDIPATWVGEPVSYRDLNKLDEGIIKNAIAQYYISVNTNAIFISEDTESTIVAKGPTGSANTSAIASGFYYDDNLMGGVIGNKVTKIQIDISKAGTFSVVKGVDIRKDTYSRTTLKTFNVTAGLNTLEFDEPVIFADNEYIGFQPDGDTARFTYKANATSGYPIGFSYISGSTWVTNTANSLNIQIECYKVINRITEIEKQLVAEKPDLKDIKISIMGDSISTYSGYNPSGYQVYYPRGDVNAANRTWWGLLAQNTGATIEVNNSYSGSAVSGNNDIAMCSDARVENLGNPDIIIILAGINDFQSQSIVLGDLADMGEPNRLLFVQAYQRMLTRLQILYPEAKIFICTPIQIAVFGANDSNTFPVKNPNKPTTEYLYQYTEAIRNLAKVYGVNMIDLAKSGINYYNSNRYPSDVGASANLYTIDGIHPNYLGMQFMERYIRNALKLAH